MEKVIFDTNAYRYLVRGKTFEQVDKLVLKLKATESRNGIETLMSPIVAKELLAHVADKKDPSYHICLNAIKALYLHCGENGSYHMIASPESLIGEIFFNKPIRSQLENQREIGNMLYNIATNPSDNVFKKLKHSLLAVKHHVFEREINFANVMEQFVKANDPNAKSWEIFAGDNTKKRELLSAIRSDDVSHKLALEFLLIPYDELRLSQEIPLLSDEELYDKAKFLMNTFPEPIALFKQVMENLVNSEFNLLKDNRVNFLWDILLMFNIGSHSVNNSKLYFVTDDKAILRNAIKNNAKYSILTYDEYLDYLK